MTPELAALVRALGVAAGMAAAIIGAGWLVG